MHLWGDFALYICKNYVDIREEDHTLVDQTESAISDKDLETNKLNTSFGFYFEYTYLKLIASSTVPTH